MSLLAVLRVKGTLGPFRGLLLVVVMPSAVECLNKVVERSQCHRCARRRWVGRSDRHLARHTTASFDRSLACSLDRRFASGGVLRLAGSRVHSRYGRRGRRADARTSRHRGLEKLDQPGYCPRDHVSTSVRSSLCSLSAGRYRGQVPLRVR